jgi:polyamine oxidase
MARLTRRTLLEIGGIAGVGTLLAPPSRAQLMNYDDGNTEIPVGATGPVESVIVIGAGFSGLVVANAMHAAGVPVVVVEGRDRLGGRTATQMVGGVPLDFGAAWVHGPIGNPVATWAAQVGVPLTPFDLGDGNLSGYDPERPPDGSIPTETALAAFGLAQNFLLNLDALRLALGPNASVRDGIIQHLDNEGFAVDNRRLIEFLIQTALVELGYAGAAADISLAWYSEDLVFFGSDVIPVGGYVRLVDALSDGLDIRLNETVTDIAYGSGGVTVTTTSDVHVGSHVVVTVPLGVLKTGTIAFSPALPATKTAAITALDMGNLERIYLQFPTAFWQGVVPARENFFYVSNVTQGEYPFFSDWTSVKGGVPTLACGVAGDFGAALTGLSEPEISARIVAILGEIFPGVPLADRTPTQVAISDWTGDPFAGGSYSFIPVGASPSDMDDLAAPVGGRVLFAGEATQSDYYATVHGAMLSGIREAKRLLAQPSVALPEPNSWLLQGVGLGALLLLARWRSGQTDRETETT